MSRQTRLAKLQAASGLAFAFFLTLHLATTAAGAGGEAAYDGALAALRRIYRPVLAVELMLIAIPALVHVTCAIAQIVDRRRRGVPASSPLAHRLAGYVLLAAIGGHVFATRVMPAFGDGPADFSYLAYSLLNWPLFMRPYYVLLGAAGAVHLVIGATIACRVLGIARPGPRVALAGAAAAAIVVAFGVAGIIGGAGDASRERFPAFRALYERFMPFRPPRL
jgi:succinate dehydrogenase/fumarate reductase cytochrome b subunit